MNSSSFDRETVSMADDEAIDDIMNSPTKPESQSSPQDQVRSRPQTASELPGGIDDNEEPSAPQLAEEERRPSTTLEVDPEGGVATMSESNVLPARLPPLVDDGPLRQNIELASNISEVCKAKLSFMVIVVKFETFQKRLKGQRRMMTTLECFLNDLDVIEISEC